MSCWPVSSAEQKSTPFKAALVATATYPGYVRKEDTSLLRKMCSDAKHKMSWKQTDTSAN
eukprot:scaffold335168_cov162-Cyclotella_meneghiniana.AAC.1